MADLSSASVQGSDRWAVVVRTPTGTPRGFYGPRTVAGAVFWDRVANAGSAESLLQAPILAVRWSVDGQGNCLKGSLTLGTLAPPFVGARDIVQVYTLGYLPGESPTAYYARYAGRAVSPPSGRVRDGDWRTVELEGLYRDVESLEAPNTPYERGADVGAVVRGLLRAVGRGWATLPDSPSSPWLPDVGANLAGKVYPAYAPMDEFLEDLAAAASAAGVEVAYGVDADRAPFFRPRHTGSQPLDLRAPGVTAEPPQIQADLENIVTAVRWKLGSGNLTRYRPTWLQPASEHTLADGRDPITHVSSSGQVAYDAPRSVQKEAPEGVPGLIPPDDLTLTVTDGTLVASYDGEGNKDLTPDPARIVDGVGSSFAVVRAGTPGRVSMRLSAPSLAGLRMSEVAGVEIVCAPAVDPDTEQPTWQAPQNATVYAHLRLLTGGEISPLTVAPVRVYRKKSAEAVRVLLTWGDLARAGGDALTLTSSWHIRLDIGCVAPPVKPMEWAVASFRFFRVNKAGLDAAARKEYRLPQEDAVAVSLQGEYRPLPAVGVTYPDGSGAAGLEALSWDYLVDQNGARTQVKAGQRLGYGDPETARLEIQQAQAIHRIRRLGLRARRSEPLALAAYTSGVGGGGDAPTDDPDGPGGFSASFDGVDAIFSWNPVPDVDSYEVEVWAGGTLRRTEAVQQPAYVYTLAKNRADNPAPAPTVEVRVRSVRGGARSGQGFHSVSNPAPAAPGSVALAGEVLGLVYGVGSPAEPDVDHLEIQADDNPSFSTPRTYRVYGWSGQKISLESLTGPTHVRSRWVDVFGQAGAWSPAVSSSGQLVGADHIADQAVGVAKFAAGIRPVQIVPSLPALPSPAYPQGAVVFNTADNKLYRSTGSSWTASVAASDLAGMLGGANLLTNSSFDVDSNGDGVADGWSVYNNTGGSEPASAGLVATGGWQNGRYQRVSWSNPNTSTKGLHRPSAVPGGWVLGQWYVVSWYAKASGSNVGRVMYMFWNTAPQDQVAVLNPPLSSSWQRYAFRVRWTSGTPANEFFISIQDNSGTTGQLDFDAVQVEEGEALTAYAPKPGEILPGSITQTEIADGSVTTPKLVAGAVTAGVIAAGAVQAQHLAAGSVVAGKIAAGAVGAAEIAARAITAAKLAIGDYSNLVINDASATGDLADWSLVTLTPWGGGAEAPWAIVQADRDAYFQNPGSGPPWGFPVEPGKGYFVRCRAYTPTTNPSSYPFGPGLLFRDVNGNILGWYRAAQISASASWQNVGGIVIAPPNAAFASFWTQIDKPAGTELDKPWFYSHPVVRRAGDGELTVDGSITANKLYALQLSAIVGTFGGAAGEVGIDSRGVRLYEGVNNPSVAFGDLGGLQWGNTVLPSGTRGFWAKPGGGLYLPDFPLALFATSSSRVETIFFTGSIPAGGSTTLTVTSGAFAFPARAVASGRRLAGMPIIAVQQVPNPLRMTYVNPIVQFSGDGTNWYEGHNIPGGTTINRVRMRVVASFHNDSGFAFDPASTLYIYWDLLVFEIKGF